MMTALGHEVIHYGHEDSDLSTEHVTVTNNKILEATLDPTIGAITFSSLTQTISHTVRSTPMLLKRLVSGSSSMTFYSLWGAGHRPICDAHPDLIVVEPGIGYADGHWADWKIFESYAILHAYQGLSSVGTCKQNWYDVVIPNYFDLNDFEYAPETKEDYFLFMGRVYPGKGVDIAIDVTRHIGAKLIVAGQP